MWNSETRVRKMVGKSCEKSCEVVKVKNVRKVGSCGVKWSWMELWKWRICDERIREKKMREEGDEKVQWIRNVMRRDLKTCEKMGRESCEKLCWDVWSDTNLNATKSKMTRQEWIQERSKAGTKKDKNMTYMLHHVACCCDVLFTCSTPSFLFVARFTTIISSKEV